MIGSNARASVAPRVLTLFLLCGVACDTGSGGSDDGGAAASADSTAAVDAGLDAVAADVGAPDAHPDAEPDGPAPDEGRVPEAVCETYGMPSVAMQAGEGGVLFGDLAGDFTVETLDGEWNLAERWSGCESYVFVTYIQDLRANPGAGWPGDVLWDTEPLALIDDGPRNVHYFFSSMEPDEAVREARMVAFRRRITLGLSFGDYPPEEGAYWLERMHFVTDRVTEIDGSVGTFVSDYMDYLFAPDSRVDLGDRGQAQPPLPFAFGIGRDQRWDPGGSLNEIVGRPPAFVMAAFLAHFYNYRAGLRERVAAEVDVTEVVLLDERVTDRVFVRTVELPDGEAMGGVDTLEFDVGVTCPHRNPFGCSEWDRIARIEWCEDAECAARHEVVRWITPYWRRGHRRWVMDASPFLGLMRAGGTQTFRVEMGPGWERGTERDARVTVRLSTRGDRPRSQAVQRAFGGGGFGGDYNNREPVVFTPRADASRVELVVILSGHGQTDGDNCAEWCDHRHHFTVNDTALPVIRPTDATGTLRGCAVRAVEGVPPGQWGNWAPGRAYWCPGLPVETLRFDLTGAVTLGVENQLSYRGTFRDGEPAGGDIALSTYVVTYTD